MLNVTEETYKKWVREEQERRVYEEQQNCLHLKSGTLINSIVVCDQCKKPLSKEDAGGYIE